LTSHLHRDIDLDIDLPYTHYYTHPTPLGRVTHQLAHIDLVVVVFVLVSDHIDIAGISAGGDVNVAEFLFGPGYFVMENVD
jgi:hypothetical protein